MKAIVSVHGCCKRRVFTTEGTEITEAKAHVMSVTHLWVFHCGSVLAREFVSSLFLALRVQARSHSASQKNGAVRYGASLQKALLVDCEGVFRGGTTAPTGRGLQRGESLAREIRPCPFSVLFFTSPWVSSMSGGRFSLLNFPPTGKAVMPEWGSVWDRLRLQANSHSALQKSAGASG